MIFGIAVMAVAKIRRPLPSVERAEVGNEGRATKTINEQRAMNNVGSVWEGLEFKPRLAGVMGIRPITTEECCMEPKP